MKIVITERCGKRVRKLSKKYVSIVNDFRNFLNSLHQNPTQGDALGRNCYKVRLAITSKGVGKSYGARAITYVKIVDDMIYVLSVYDKSDKKDISDKELDYLLKEAGLK